MKEKKMFFQKPYKLSFIANCGITLWHDKREILKQECIIEKHGKQLKQHTSKMSGSCCTSPRVINNELLLNVITSFILCFPNPNMRLTQQCSEGMRGKC